MVKIFISGILLRVILMVSSCHFDLLSYYWYAHFLVYHRRIPADLFGGAIYLWPMAYIHSLWLFFIRGFMNKGIDLWPEVWFLQNRYHMVNLETWQQFVSQPNIGWILFLFKLPYLIAELIMIILIIKMLSPDESKRKVLNFLVFNPISLFVIYILGTFDIVLVLLVVLSLYLIKKHKYYLSIFSLGISILVKLYALYLFPLFVVIISREISRKWSRRLKLALCGLLPTIIVLIIAQLKGKLGALIKFAANAPYSEYIVSLLLPFQHLSDRIYPFIIGYSLIILYYIYTHTYQKNNLFYDLSKYTLILILLIYSLAFFHPQYFLLIVPLIALQINKDRRLLPLFLIQVISFFIYTFQWGRDLSWRLFMPLNPQFFTNLSSPAEFIWQFYPADKFIGIFRSIFSGVSFWMIYLLFKK